MKEKTKTTIKSTTIEFPEHRVFEIIKDYVKKEYGLSNVEVRLDNDFRYGCSADMTITSKTEDVF